jgi:DNA-binding response OmpR family regulator
LSVVYGVTEWTRTEKDDGTEERRIMMAAQNFANETGRSVVVGLPESPMAAALEEQLRSQGWTVHRTTSCAKARRLACRHLPDALILPADSPDESGWLVCAKLVRAQPRLRVVLVGERTPFAVQFARFVGATALMPPTTGAEELVERIEGAVVQLV